MPIGVILNCLAVAVGGMLGAALGDRIPGKLKEELTMVFGLCAIGMGVCSIVVLSNLPAVIFSVIVGTAVGLSLRLDDRVRGLLGRLEKPLGSLMKQNVRTSQDEYMSAFLTVLVLFCASANGIYGSLDSGFSGDHTILISKSIMDFFTAMIFGCSLGKMVSLISIPQFVIFIAVFFLAQALYPLTTPTMLNDFKGCGGILLAAAGLRIMKLREFPLVDMIPAMIIVMPVSWIWTNWVVPLL